MVRKSLFPWLFLLSLVLWSSTSIAQRSSFGEACDDTIKCDKRAWLTCRNGTCDCMKPDVMMYEDSLGKCASKAGERCKFIIEEFDNNNVFEMISCIQDSSCSGEGFCVCDNKFYEDLNGTCTSAQSHMESCNSQVKCSTFEALQCVDGLCKCNESISTYYSSEEISVPQCVGLAGESCINSKCVENAVCSNENICVCDDEHYQDEEKKCVPKIGVRGNCTINEQCMNFQGTQLICLNGACSCNPRVSRFGNSRRHRRDNWNYGYYDSNSYEGGSVTQCLGLAGSPCLDRLCVENSYCEFKFRDSSSRDNSGTCKCMSSYRQSRSGNCARGFNEHCTTSYGCIDGLVCGGDGGQRCRCPYEEQAFDGTSRCVSKVDGPCNSLYSCVPNSKCILLSKEPFEAGHCSCKTGYVKNSEGKCDLAFGSPCTHGSQIRCDYAALLQCINFKCQCSAFAEYSAEHRVCLGLVGAPCDLNSFKLCVKNSECKIFNPRLQGVCVCPAGFQETSQYTCEPVNQVVKMGPTHDEE